MKESDKPYVGDLEKFVLQAILNLNNSAYGMEIREEIRKKINKSLSYAAIYTTLERLKNKKMLSTEKGEISEERGGRAKVYFSVTGVGQDTLREALIDFKKIGILGNLSHA